MKQKKNDHYSRVSWHSVDYWLLNGFLVPERAYSALSELITLGRYPDLDTAIREGIRTVIEENASLLVRTDHKWIPQLASMDEAFKDPASAKPDNAGKEHLRFLNQMYQAMNKADGN